VESHGIPTMSRGCKSLSGVRIAGAAGSDKPG
jgi:hypothetical protein